MNLKFWFWYLDFVTSFHGSRSRMKAARKMAESASTFRHCKIILAPTSFSHSLNRMRDRTFSKALKLAANYDEALILCNWAKTQLQREMAYSLMIRNTAVTCNEHRLQQLVNDYGIGLKIRTVNAEDLLHLGKIFETHLHTVGEEMTKFLSSLQAAR